MDRRNFLTLTASALSAILVSPPVPATAGNITEEKDVTDEDEGIISLFEIETLDLAKSIQYISIPKNEKGQYIPVPITYDTLPWVMDQYHSFLKHLILGNLQEAGNIANKLVLKTDIISIENATKQSLRAKALGHQVMAVLNFCEGKHKLAIDHVNKILKYTVMGEDLSYLLYVFPDIVPILIKNGFFHSLYLLGNKVNTLFYKSYRPFFFGKNENIESRINFALLRTRIWKTLKSAKKTAKYIKIIKIEKAVKSYSNVALKRVDIHGLQIASFYGIEDGIFYIEDAINIPYLRKYALTFLKKESGKIASTLQEANPNHFLLGEYYLQKGYLLFESGFVDQAIELGKKALAIFEKVQGLSSVKQVYAVNLIIEGYIKKDDAQNVLTYSKKAMQILKSIKSDEASKDYINALSTMSEAFYLNKDYDRAIQYIKMAIKQAKDVYGVSSNEVKILKKALEFLENEKEVSSPF